MVISNHFLCKDLGIIIQLKQPIKNGLLSGTRYSTAPNLIENHRIIPPISKSFSDTLSIHCLTASFSCLPAKSLWPFWDGENNPFNGCWWPRTIGDKKVTKWITWKSSGFFFQNSRISHEISPMRMVWDARCSKHVPVKDLKQKENASPPLPTRTSCKSSTHLN